MPPKSCYQRAVDLLSRRAHFVAELQAKLHQRGFETDEIQEAIARLQSHGYLDDRDTTRLWVEQQLARKPQGARKLFSGLLRKGVDSDLAHETITEILADNEATLAQEAAERWSARTPNGNAAGLARHLDRMGFRTSTAVSVVQHMRERLQS